MRRRRRRAPDLAARDTAARLAPAACPDADPCPDAGPYPDLAAPDLAASQVPGTESVNCRSEGRK